VRRTLDKLLGDARARIKRLTPAEALAASADGALIVDIRSDVDREQTDVIPGSIHIPRTVLEWHLDPASPWRNPHVGELDQPIVILCDHGYSSSLAAATLVDLGFDATDVIGGFEAWQEDGLPVRPQTRRPEWPALAGMEPPDP
jgi:rhodanese-related sulfurtransferase